jgi:hypothetical protein
MDFSSTIVKEKRLVGNISETSGCGEAVEFED